MQSFWKSCIYVHRDEVFLMDIDELIKRGIQGDETAFRNLYATYHRRMAEICQRIVGDRRVAEELANDAFLLAFAKMDTLRNPRRFEAWLTSIATNVALRYKKRHCEPAMLSLSTLKEEDLAQEATPTDVRPLPTTSELMDAVDALPKGYGQVFKLAVIEEMSHKEIAEIMGIAAHSSSSQLTRAKKMLQKLLAHYWMLWILPLLMPLTYFLLRTGNQPEEPKTTATRNGHPAKPPVVSPKVPDTQKDTAHRTVAVPVTFHSTDSITSADTIPHNMKQADTVVIKHDDQPLPDVHSSHDSHILAEESTVLRHRTADLPTKRPSRVKGKQTSWAIDVAYAGNMGTQTDIRPFAFTETPLTDATTELASPQTFENWGDYATFLANIPVEGDFHKQQILMRIAQNNASQSGTDKIVRTSHHYMPVTWSLALKYRLGNRFSLETGLSYSRLKSEFETGTGGNAIREQQDIHYVGIPLKSSYNIYHGKQWSVYGSLGIKADIPAHASLSTSYLVNGTTEATDKATLSAPLQWSAGTGLGLQYNLTPNIGFFAEPSLQYYIPTGSSTESYYTEHPFTFSLPLGIRITW